MVWVYFPQVAITTDHARHHLLDGVPTFTAAFVQEQLVAANGHGSGFLLAGLIMV
jgi:hypothetical protein